MKCPKCGEEGSLNEVRGKTYWYCRTCKDEIIPPKVEEIDPFQEAIDEEWAKHHKRFFGSYSNLETITLPRGLIVCPLTLKVAIKPL